MDTIRPLTRAEVADLFKVSTKTVDRWVKAGLITPVKIRGSVRFIAADVEALLTKDIGA